jgi:hypothetical protein
VGDEGYYTRQDALRDDARLVASYERAPFGGPVGLFSLAIIVGVVVGATLGAPWGLVAVAVVAATSAVLHRRH